MTETGVLLLAAGSSSRLGQPKQNLPFEGQTLLQRSIQTALVADLGPVVVVLGANAPVIEASLAIPQVQVVHNPDWETGMASSIRTGVNVLLASSPEIKDILILLCDQPFITPDVLQQMKQKAETTGKGIVACSYQGTLGAPVLFHRQFFRALQTLAGQEGAKKVVMQFKDRVAEVPFEPAAIDIDTLTDYHALQATGLRE